MLSQSKTLCCILQTFDDTKNGKSCIRPLKREKMNYADSNKVRGKAEFVKLCMQEMPGSSSQPATDYTNWPIKELRRLLQERGVDVSGMVEKAELVERARDLEAAQSHQVRARVWYLVLQHWVTGSFASQATIP